MTKTRVISLTGVALAAISGIAYYCQTHGIPLLECVAAGIGVIFASKGKPE